MIRINSEGEIFVSFPRYNDNQSYPTFTKFVNDTNSEPYFAEWPTGGANLSSVDGFEIDDKDNMFILDQGNKLLQIFSKQGNVLGSIDLSQPIINSTSIYLHDIVLDPVHSYAFISNCNSYDLTGNSSLSEITPQLVIINYTLPTGDNDNNIKYSISVVTDDTFLPDKSYWLHVNDKPVSESGPALIGLSSLAISCNFDYLYYSPLSSDKIYSIKVEELISSSVMTNVNENYKGFASSSILTSGNGHLYLTDLNSGLIKQYKQLSNLDEMNYKNFVQLHSKQASQGEWPSSIALNNDILYYITNNYHLYSVNGTVPVAILSLPIANEKRYINGCSYDSFTTSYKNVILWIIFSILILVVLSFVLINSQKKEESTEKIEADSFVD